MTRLTLDESDWTSAQRHAADVIANGPRGRVTGPFRVLLRNPDLALKVQDLGKTLRFEGELPSTLREIAILVTARHWHCSYEFWSHSQTAAKVGVTADLIEAIQKGRPDEGANAAEAMVVAFCRELHATRSITDSTFEKAVAIVGESGVVELIGLCGYYAMLAMLLNVAGVNAPEQVLFQAEHQV